ncbi:lysosomal acid glucosylceramidase-like [Linepithema humile]|uniref:lysosomal acid glucosylceramidase-like n=1 Tax=Linepithema humile TaxID=83485 RepID=UPI00351DC48D
MLREAILLAVFVTIKSNTCVQRLVGPNAIVCVCNSTYCDALHKPKLQAGQFQFYTSTKNGERLQLTIGNFSTETINGTLLTVNSSQKDQEIFGFGAAMTDSVALNLRALSNNTQQKLLESYFGPPGIGIGYTHVRIPIGGTDFSTRPYTYHDIPDDITLSNFNLVEEDNYKIGYLHKIKRIMSDPESLRILAVSWTAPIWMKTTNNIRWGILKSEHYQTYANYIRMFFDAYKRHGINIWGVSPSNEPLDGFYPKWSFNAMGWTPNASAFWSVNHLVPTLRQAGYNPVFLAMEDQRHLLPCYVDEMFTNEKVRELFSGITVHWYLDQYISPRRLIETHNKYPDKFILITEACNGAAPLEVGGVDLGSWDRGEYYMSNIIENLSYWVNGWIDWNMALDINGGPNWSTNYVDSAIIVIPENDEFYKQPTYYAISHVSNFVPRHSRKILSTGLENNENVTAVAFLTPQKEIVVVAINKNDKPVNVTVKDNNADRKINLRLPAHSFNTLLYLANQ